jgi:hypothetical protein
LGKHCILILCDIIPYLYKDCKHFFVRIPSLRLLERPGTTEMLSTVLRDLARILFCWIYPCPRCMVWRPSKRSRVDSLKRGSSPLRSIRPRNIFMQRSGQRSPLVSRPVLLIMADSPSEFSTLILCLQATCQS